MSLLQPRIVDAERVEGKRVFLAILLELQAAIKIVRGENRHSNLKLSTTDELHVAYYCVFFGISNNSLIPLWEALPGATKNRSGQRRSPSWKA